MSTPRFFARIQLGWAREPVQRHRLEEGQALGPGTDTVCSSPDCSSPVLSRTNPPHSEIVVQKR